VLVLGLLAVSRVISISQLDSPGPPPVVTAQAEPEAAAPAAAPPIARPVSRPASRPAPRRSAPVRLAAAERAAAPATAPVEAVTSAPAAPEALVPTDGAAPAAKQRPRTGATRVDTAAERQRAYRLAMQDYAREEREAGYQWARRNKVAVREYCRATRRTPDFTQGCLAYLQAGRG